MVFTSVKRLNILGMDILVYNWGVHIFLFSDTIQLLQSMQKDFLSLHLDSVLAH